MRGKITCDIYYPKYTYAGASDSRQFILVQVSHKTNTCLMNMSKTR